MFTTCPSTLTTSSASSTVEPSLVTTCSLTETLPSAINFSEFLRDATPERAKYFCSLIILHPLVSCERLGRRGVLQLRCVLLHRVRSLPREAFPQLM